MTLQQLKYIIKIVECGSITEAAKKLFITQPSLSSSVKELEKELGFELFSRSAKGISLTVDGAEFLSYARQVVEQEELLEQRYLGKKPSRQLCSISTQSIMPSRSMRSSSLCVRAMRMSTNLRSAKRAPTTSFRM